MCIIFVTKKDEDRCLLLISPCLRSYIDRIYIVGIYTCICITILTNGKMCISSTVSRCSRFHDIADEPRLYWPAPALDWVDTSSA